MRSVAATPFAIVVMYKHFLVALILFSVADPLFAKGLTPTSPEIVESVNRAAEFLKMHGTRENRLGGRALASLALLKAGADPEHPFITSTASAVKSAVAADGTITITDHIYTAGLVVLFLCELNSDLYRRELDAFGRYLQKNQRSDGAWTYMTAGSADAYPSGDMSMTQYGVMALWTLHQHGFDVSGENIDRVCRWLATAQRSDGAYAYQTRISDGGKNISHEGVRLSMSAAGMASVYVCRHLCGFGISNSWEQANAKIPDGFSEIKQEDAGLSLKLIGGFRFTVRENTFNTLQQRGNHWLNQHFSSASTTYYHYYLYAFERYAAFRELAENVHHESPSWYDKTATHLLKTQRQDGSWFGDIGAVVDTAYSILFLLRSTDRTFQKIQINRYGGGDLLGGRGLPKLTSQLKIEDGKVISLSEIGDASQLMDRLARLEETDDETLALLAELPTEETGELLHRNKSKMKRLLGQENAEHRFAAVQLLAKSGDVSNSPAMIYALSDPNPDVAQAALNGLNRLARNPTSEKLPTEESQINRLIDRWKQWYRKIDPDVAFEER